ncbi:Hypothetical predicted protein [Podarcis lilfordi]|uniref:Uncharacterized protein n=1 Tax=Podarcis lilfordi TaxID=74358 RepID=A0AA35PGY3_9SAUR|nr:Hypothetical predicted protein [Podarcis lilfordi]
MERSTSGKKQIATPLMCLQLKSERNLRYRFLAMENAYNTSASRGKDSKGRTLKPLSRCQYRQLTIESAKR